MKLHEIFEQVVNENPNAIAVKFQGKKYSYHEINEEANKLANYLKTNFSDQKQPIIGVHLGPSENRLIAMLAVSKLGAVYVPLETAKDKAIQDKYLTGICEDSKVNLIISEHDLSLGYDCPKIYLGKEKEQKLIRESSANSVKPIYSAEDSDQVAYYCYSSGTTGSPKGIPICHAGLDKWYQKLQSLRSDNNPNRVVLSHIATGFDAHIWEYIMAWSLKGSLCVAKQESTSQDLANLMEAEEVTDATLVPAILRPIVNLPSPPRKNNLNVYSTGSELTKELTEKCMAQGYEVYNCFGPTEATFGLTCYKMQYKVNQNQKKALDFYSIHKENSKEIRELAPMGTAHLDNIEIFILDEKDQVMTGENRTGRFAYASPYLTKGYLGKDEETQKNFINIKTPQDKTVRVHKTDDICTIQNNNLYFVTRVGNNLKIDSAYSNGDCIKKYLIEKLKDKILCAEIVSFNGPPPYSVAFYQPNINNNPPVQLNDVYKLLRSEFGNQQNIPYLQAISKMPVNNKYETDIAALKLQAKKVNRDDSRTYKPPATYLQKELVALWAEDEILGNHGIIQAEIGITDDFGMFGTSMDRRVLLEKVNGKYRICIDFASFWDNDFTIEYLEGLVNEELSKFKPSVLKKPSNQTQHSPFFLFPPITGDANDYGTLATALKGAGVEQAVYGFKAPGLIDPAYVKLNTQQLIDHYYLMLKNAQPHGPYYLGGWSSGALIAYGVAQKLNENQDEVHSLVLIDEAAPPKSAKNYDPLKFANDFIELVKHLPADISLELLENLCEKTCEKQVEFVFKNLTPKKNVPQAKDTLAVVQQFLLGLLKHDFKPINNTEIQVFYSDNTLNNNNNNNQLLWNQYGKVTKTERVGKDHFSIMQQPKGLADEISKLIKVESSDNEKMNLENKTRTSSNASSGSLVSSGSSDLTNSPPNANHNLLPTTDSSIDTVNHLIYQTMEKALETPCNALTVLKLLQILIEWYASALDKIGSEFNINNPIPTECKQDELLFNKAVSGILKRLEEKAFVGQQLPEWLTCWMTEVKAVIEKPGLSKTSKELQTHLVSFQKISYLDGTDKLDTVIENLKADKKVEEFLLFTKQSREAISLLKKGDTKPFYRAITSKTIALDNTLKNIPEKDFHKDYTFT